MADTYIQDFTVNLEEQAHVWVSAQDFVTAIQKVTDDASRQFFDSVELLKLGQLALYKSSTPYCLITIGPSKVLEKSIEGVILKKQVPIIVQCVFKTGPRNEDGSKVDLQGYIAWLEEKIESVLQPYDEIYPNGMIRETPYIWSWSDGSTDKSRAGRALTEIGGIPGKQLSGSAWSLNLTYNINVYPWVKLPV